MNKHLIIAASLLALSCAPALANDESHHMHAHHMHGDMHGDAHNPCAMKGEDLAHMKGMFLEKKEIDGFTVSFHVMKASDGMQHGGSHNYMIKVEKDGAVTALSAVNSKIKRPDGSSDSKMMMKMGDWYMAGYDLSAPGEYQLMVLFKTEDGKKHFGGLKYKAGQ